MSDKGQVESSSNGVGVGENVRIEDGKEEKSEEVERKEVMEEDVTFLEEVQVTNTKDCGCDCKGENDLLKKAVVELSSRNSLLEDFIQVEFGDRFKAFADKRQHLIDIGFGAGNTPQPADGKRSDWSKELVELLSAVKAQGKEEITKTKPSIRVSVSDGHVKTKPASPAPSTSRSTKPSSPKKAAPAPAPSTSQQSVPKKRKRGRRPQEVRVSLSCTRTQNRITSQIQNRRPILLSNGSISSTSNYSTVKPRHPIFSRPASSLVAQNQPPPQSSLPVYSQSWQQPHQQPQQFQSRGQPQRTLQTTEQGEDDYSNSYPKLWRNQDTQRSKRLMERRVCPVCSLVMKRATLKNHLVGTHKHVSFPCPVCQTSIQYKNFFMLHMKQFHPDYQGNLQKYMESVEKPVMPWVAKMLSIAKPPTDLEYAQYERELQERNHLKEEEKMRQAEAEGYSTAAATSQGQMLAGHSQMQLNPTVGLPYPPPPRPNETGHANYTDMDLSSFGSFYKQF